MTKKINTAKKGWRKEKQCRDELKAEGYSIPFQSIRTRWASYDFADLFDVVAIKGKERIYVSCKHRNAGAQHHPVHQEEIRCWKEKHGLLGESFQLWIWNKPRWTGRKPNKVWVEGHWDKKIL